jgi:hypothetical protein
MDQLLKMAADSGMTKEQGEAATGGIFSLVKKGLSSGDFSKITKMIPEVEGLIKEHETSTKDAGGAGDVVGSAMSAMGGGKTGAGGSADTAGGSAGGIASLLASLSSKGVSAKELNKFMPQVVSMVKTQAGVDISKILGVSAATPSTGGTADPASSESKNPISRFMGMFGKKQKA